jgi:hypothetical protein
VQANYSCWGWLQGVILQHRKSRLGLPTGHACINLHARQSSMRQVLQNGTQWWVLNQGINQLSMCVAVIAWARTCMLHAISGGCTVSDTSSYWAIQPRSKSRCKILRCSKFPAWLLLHTQHICRTSCRALEQYLCTGSRSASESSGRVAKAVQDHGPDRFGDFYEGCWIRRKFHPEIRSLYRAPATITRLSYNIINILPYAPAGHHMAPETEGCLYAYGGGACAPMAMGGIPPAGFLAVI